MHVLSQKKKKKNNGATGEENWWINEKSQPSKPIPIERGTITEEVLHTFLPLLTETTSAEVIAEST